MRSKRTALVSLTLVALVASACGSDDQAEPGGSATTVAAEPSTSVAVVPTSEPAADRGWIDGEPEWSGGSGGGAAESASSEVVASPVDMSVASSDSYAEESAGAPPPEFDVPAIEPCVDCDVPVNDSPLRAGSVDDNADFQGFLDYLARIDELGIERRDFDPTGRSVVTVTGDDGRPVAGIVVTAEANGITATLRTTADGTARFHPAVYGIGADAVISYSVQAPEAETVAESDAAVAAVGEDVALETTAVATSSPVPLDVLFLLDATGSMGDEIDRLKSTIDTVADRIAQLEPAPDVRFAMTLYRDEGDAFVTSTFDFTGDIVTFQAALADVVADGGDDYPEALDEGLAAALGEPSWRDPSQALQLVFVVADAPPQVGRQVDVPYTDSIRTAIDRGIKIFPIASSESDDQAEVVFRQIAQATGAPFVFLSRGADGASVGENSDIASTDYEELALDELVVRLVAEELSDLAGDITVPTTTAPPTTNPDGQ